MDLSGTRKVHASRAIVYAALLDAEVLRRCIPGCRTIEKGADGELTATIGRRIGPVRVSFEGRVSFSDLDPPCGYTLSGAGSAGGAGHASGSARIRLVADGAATDVAYEVEADVGGRVARLGTPLIQGIAKILVAEFFAKLNTVVKGGAPFVLASTDSTTSAKVASPRPQKRT